MEMKEGTRERGKIAYENVSTRGRKRNNVLKPCLGSRTCSKYSFKREVSRKSNELSSRYWATKMQVNLAVIFRASASFKCKFQSEDEYIIRKDIR